MKKIFAIALASFLALSSAAEAKEKYYYDPAHTQIMFSVSHLGFSFSHGRFVKFTGGFDFDPEAPEKSVVEIAINTNSIRMDDDAWEKHLKGPDFFNVEKFPEMTFKGTGIEKTGDKTGKLTGDLTILGVTKPVTLDVTFNGSGTHPYTGKLVAGFSAETSIKRSDFGMGYGIPNVGDDVKIEIQVEGLQKDFEGMEKK